jgi:hypothetical protein
MFRPRKPLVGCALLLLILSFSVPALLIALLTTVRLFPGEALYHRIRSYAGYVGYGWCHPVLPPKVHYSFTPAPPWEGDAAFWENFPCARSEYRVWLPEGSAGAQAAAAAAGGNATNLIVSAYFDIGRSRWPYFSRSNEQYMANIANSLTLRNPMVFFTTPDKAEGIVAARRAEGLMDRTMVVAHDLHCASQAWMLPGVLDSMCSARTVAALWTLNPSLEVPERQEPWYNIIMWTKAGVVRAVATLPQAALASQWVTWFDAGCHAPACAGWVKGAYFSPAPWARSGRVRIAHMDLQSDALALMSPTEWTRQHPVLFMGTVFGAQRQHAARLMDAFLDTVQWLYVRGVVDTDQTVFAWMWQRFPELFDVYPTVGDYQGKLATSVKGFAGLS